MHNSTAVDEQSPARDDGEPSPLLRYHELAGEGVPFSRQHLQVLEERGEFPRRVRLSANVIAWDRAEVRAWRASRTRSRE
jgi:predicted DNA-binding transcriptional regulator AlpA